ncbi:hypothetical protein BGW41_005399 [Actinomortierella wolfii]|nr:hypothetical protein BGW41_005399 [Actinomortierella wolfii]
MAQPQKAVAEADLEKCFELIRPGTSHEEKFVGLILMSKLLNNPEPERVRLFFDNMDHQFLDRMLKITPDQLPEDGGVDVQTVKTIAVDILTCFASNWELLIRKEFKDHLPALLTLVSAKDSSDNTQNILRILLKISVYPQVSMILTNPDYQRVIVSYILETIDNDDEAHRDACMICKRTFLIIQEGYKQNAQAVTDISRQFWPTILTQLSKPFAQPTEPHKTQILQLLIDTLSFAPEPLLKYQVKTYPSESRTWIRNLKSGLLQLLSTMQAPTVRGNSFILTGILLQKLGSSWLFPEKTSTEKSGSTARPKVSPASLVSSVHALSLTDQELDKKFTSLVIHLICVEIRVLMDELGEELEPSNSSKSSVDKKQQTSADSADTTKDDADRELAKTRKEKVLPLAYEILETAIAYLIQVAENEIEDSGLFDATALLKLQEALQSTFAAILDYLRDVQSHITRPEELVKDMVFLASLRILSVWLMEDNSLHSQATALTGTVEAMVKFCKTKSKYTSLVRILEPIMDQFHDLSLDE